MHFLDAVLQDEVSVPLWMYVIQYVYVFLRGKPILQVVQIDRTGGVYAGPNNRSHQGWHQSSISTWT